MKKFIALILILVVTSSIVVSKNDTSLNMNLANDKSNNPSQYNKNWEYVKDRLFDGETETVYKREGPILISLKYASKQDSLIVNEIIRELRTVIPNETVDYFDNFTGVSFDIALRNGYNEKYKGISLWDLSRSTTELGFYKSSGVDNRLESEKRILYLMPPKVDSERNIDYRLPNEIGKITRGIFDSKSENYYSPISISFDINKEITYNERKTYIQYELLRSLCYIQDANFIPVTYGKGNVNSIFKSTRHNPENSKFTDSDKFLLKKLYSDDFIEQFKDYMYANYPWRYASSFTNKKAHEFKVWGIIIVVGVVVFVLMFSFFQNRKFKYNYLNYLFPIFIILMSFISFSNFHNLMTDFRVFVSWWNALFSLLITPILFAPLISFVLWGLEKNSFKKNESFSYQLILKVIFTFVSFIAPLTLIFLESDREGFFEFILPYVFFSAALAIGRGLLLYLNHFSASLVKEKDVELSRLQEAKAEAEVKVLQSQINPHFLYNALNSIASLAHTDADKTEKMALSLSDLFRHSINRKGKKVNTLGDELSLVQNYLEIEQIRFGDRLDFSIDVDADLLNVEIPMFILQPLVENAIKHGISKIEGQGQIILKVSEKGEGILISIQDNGPDFPEGLVSGHGLQTVYDLLRFTYGDKAEMSWHNEPQKEINIQINNMI
ncbi:sensor histidine kinase [Flavobacterium sp. ARAG 55.4]|uniref:sensor histidine kinase n=1 Tax=Flavobacterium sp. ARAG 55.4 TaxID=3451357 RepID=UPI003F47FB1D